MLYHQSAVGQVIRGEWRHGVTIGTRFAGALMNLIYSFVAGWIFVRFLPKRLKAAIAVLEKSPFCAYFVY